MLRTTQIFYMHHPTDRIAHTTPVSAIAPGLVDQRAWYVVTYLRDGSYKRTCVATRKR